VRSPNSRVYWDDRIKSSNYLLPLTPRFNSYSIGVVMEYQLLFDENNIPLVNSSKITKTSLILDVCM
jgi:hypothetical protein